MNKSNLKLLLSLFLMVVSLDSLAYDFEVDGIYYILNVKEEYKTVKVVSGDIPYTGSLQIPDSIIYRDRKFAVVGIQEMKNCNLDTLTIMSKDKERFHFIEGAMSNGIVKHLVIEGMPDFCVAEASFPHGVESFCLGSYMRGSMSQKKNFYDTIGKQENLKEIVLGESVFNISSQPAFTLCEHIERVVSFNKNPTDIDINMFSTKTYLNATLYVPKGTKELYQSCKGWNIFFNITDDEVPNNIDVLYANDTTPSIYDLKGQKKSTISKGINIIRLSDGAVRKIFK